MSKELPYFIWKNLVKTRCQDKLQSLSTEAERITRGCNFWAWRPKILRENEVPTCLESKFWVPKSYRVKCESAESNMFFEFFENQTFWRINFWNCNVRLALVSEDQAEKITWNDAPRQFSVFEQRGRTIRKGKCKTFLLQSVEIWQISCYMHILREINFF